MAYEIRWTPHAGRVYKKLEPAIQRRVRETIRSLADVPRPPGCEALRGYPYFRVRVGEYRIIYQIEDDLIRVLIVHIGHRREIYDQLRNL